MISLIPYTRSLVSLSLIGFGERPLTVLPLVSVYRLLVGIPTIRQIRGVFCEWAGLYSVQLIIASYAGSTAENGKPQTTMKHNYVFYCHFYVF